MGLFSKKEKNREKTYTGIAHITGLKVPEGCNCIVKITENNVIIESLGNEFTLSIEKITNVDFKMDIDIKEYLESSTLKGLIGAATFGTVGAIIGSAPKQKEKRDVICYAIITFINTKEEHCVLILKDIAANTQICAKLVDELKPKIKTVKNKVEL